jgi:hypothetical protein
MNNRYFSGAESERDLPMSGDLQSVTVVHGPGFATYGAGALAGALNLETYNGLTFQGADAQIHQGFGDAFSDGAFLFGKRLETDSGVFFYAGIANQNGANQNSSPLVFGKTFTTPDVVSGQPVSFSVPNLHDAGGMLKVKLHASYVNGSTEIWARYTQGGGLVHPQHSTLQAGDMSLNEKGHHNLSKQFTIGRKYKQDLSDTFNLEVSTSYDQYLYQLWFYDVYPTSDDRRELEAYAIQGITAAPYGYGNDLANRNACRSSPLGYALTDPGYDAAYGPSAYWNAGLEYHPSKHLSIRADAFNILVWVDKSLNKRLYYFRGSDYSEEAPSVAISAKITF